MRKLLLLCLFIASSVLACGSLCAQNYVYATGTPAFTTQIPIENGFINVNNGEIHIEIPLAQHKQRGRLALNERLIYDSRIWKIVSSSGYKWQPTNVPNSMGGWRFTRGIEQGTVSYLARGGSINCYGQIYYTTYYQFIWTDPQGTQHPFPGVQTLGNISQRPPNCTQSSIGVTAVPSSSGIASDGSGYTIDVTNTTTAVIVDKYGNTYYPNITNGGGTVAGQNIVSDANGNYWSADSNGNLVDTLGRTPVLVTTSGNQIFYDVLGWNGARQRYTVTTESIAYSTGFGQQAVSDVSGSFTAIESIELPDGSSYSFGYDNGGYGELTSVTLPTGGTIQYNYTNFLDSFQNENRWIHTRVKDGGTTTFTPATITNCTSSAGCQESVTVTSPPSPTSNDMVYTFTLDPSSLANAASWNTQIDAYQGTGSSRTKLKSVATTYTYGTQTVSILGSGSPPADFTYEYPSGYTTTTSLIDVGMTSKEVVTLDYLEADPVTDKVWDYYPSSGSAPTSSLQETDYAYLGQSAYPTQISVKDGSGNLISQTTYGHDETSGAGHCTLSTTSGVPDHNPASGTRANVTTISRWLNTGGAFATQACYDDTGTALNSTDPSGLTTYGHDSTDTFTTSVTPPTPSSGVVLTSSTMVDVNSGLATSQTDPNGTQTIFENYDAFGRVGEVDVKASDGTAVGKIQYYYTPTETKEYRYQSATVSSETDSLLDTYGRPSRTALSSGQTGNSWYQQDTCYDLNGRVGFVSTRYQGSGFSQGIVCKTTGDTFAYDALSRRTMITHADGSVITRKYTGRATETIDEYGVSRIIQNDGLGRLSSVCEVSSQSNMPGSGSPSSCGQDIASNGYITSYTYVPAAGLTTVTQGGQTRQFTLDSLGRTVSQIEPESGTTTYSYSYTSTGLTVYRVRPAANQSNPKVTTTSSIEYDSLGRLTYVGYSDGTPAKYFYYDQPTVWGNSTVSTGASKGRLTAATSTISAQAFVYDAAGNTTGNLQCLPNFCGNGGYDKWLYYTYDWLGNKTSASDGNGVTAGYQYNQANQVNAITSNISTPVALANVVSNVVNGPFGPTSWKTSDGYGEVHSYDALGRLANGWVCSGSTQPNCAGGTTAYSYSRTTIGPYVTSTCDSAQGECMSYSYDSFGRLQSANSTSGASNSSSYTYDRWGNRWAENVTGGIGNSNQTAVNTASNQVASYTYDAAGNNTVNWALTIAYDAEGNPTSMTDAGYTYTNQYDALNRLVFASNGYSDGGGQAYTYNLSNQQVGIFGIAAGAKSFSQSWGHVEWDGRPLLLYGASPIFMHQDYLGSERITLEMQTNGTVDEYGTYLYSPFGDGVYLHEGSGGGDQPVDDLDLDDYHYAGLVTGAFGDISETREYDFPYGRWYSPDPTNRSYDFYNPQSFNRYSYVQNNPVSMTDPSGQDGCSVAIAAGGETGTPIGIGVGAAICALEAIGAGILGDDIFGWLLGPSFHGSLQPRPSASSNPNWDGNFGESLGIPTSLPQQDWGIAPALGLPDAGCEFGACGGGSTNFQAAAAAAPVPAVVCAIAEPCGALAVGATVVVGGSIVAYKNREAVKGSWTSLADSFLEGYNNLKDENNDRCAIVKQNAIASCSDQFIGRGLSESPALTRACVRVKMIAEGCFNF